MIKSNFMPCGSSGPKGDSGITPHIGDNGNWYLGEQDTGIAATGPRGQRGFRGEQGLKGKDGFSINLCDTNFDPHTTEQIDEFSQYGHVESFTKVDILENEPLEVDQQIALFIPNSDTGKDSVYFGVIKQITEESVICDAISCIHSGKIGERGPIGPQGPAGPPTNIINLEVDERGHLIATITK